MNLPPQALAELEFLKEAIGNPDDNRLPQGLRKAVEELRTTFDDDRALNYVLFIIASTVTDVATKITRELQLLN